MAKNYLLIPRDEIEMVWLFIAVEEERKAVLEYIVACEQYGAENYVADLENDRASPEDEYYEDYRYSRSALDPVLDLEASLYNTFGYEQFFREEDCQRIEEDRSGSAVGNVRSLEDLIVTRNIHWIGTAKAKQTEAWNNYKNAEKEFRSTCRSEEADWDSEEYRCHDEMQDAREQWSNVRKINRVIWSEFRNLSKIPKMRRRIPESCLSFVLEDNLSQFMAWYKEVYETPSAPCTPSNESATKLDAQSIDDDDVPF